MQNRETDEKANLEATSLFKALRVQIFIPAKRKVQGHIAITDWQLSAQPETVDLAEGANAKM